MNSKGDEPVKNSIEDLRNHLFAAIEGVMDTEKPLDVERAITVGKLAQALIGTAKVEIDFTEATGLTVPSGFFQKPTRQAALNTPESPTKPMLLAASRR
jgi:hypothetical protein